MVPSVVLLGLDFGASKVAAVVAIQEASGELNVTGAGQSDPEGSIRHGEISDLGQVVRAISRAVEEAMVMAGQDRADAARVSVGGIQFKGENVRDSISITHPDRVITAQDQDRVLEQVAQGCKLAKEERILHRIPQVFHIRGMQDIRNPVNMVGDNLEAEVRIVDAPCAVLDNLDRALELAGLQGAGLLYAPLAAAEAVLSREDAENGAVVVDIGDHLTHLGVFLRGALFHSAVIPIGGADFTRDLEITLHLGGVFAAERIKRVYGSALPTQVDPDQMVALEAEGRQVACRDLAEVLHARAVELLDRILAEIGPSGVIHEIHGGVHLVGGGSLLPDLASLAQAVLGRPRVILGRVRGVRGLDQALANPLYVNALGAVMALHRDLALATPDGTGVGRGLSGKVQHLLARLEKFV